MHPSYFRTHNFNFPSVLSHRPVSLRVFHQLSRKSRFRSVAHCSLDFSSVPFPLRRALLARLPVRYVSVSSRVPRSTSRVSFVSLRIERIALHFRFCWALCARRPFLLFGRFILETVYSVLCLVSFALGSFCVY